MILRAGFAQTVGRPDLPHIIPATNISSPDVTTPTIRISNTGLQPWTSKGYDLSLETYAIKGGTGSIAVFQKDIKDFFGSLQTDATPEALALYDLASLQSFPGEYDGYSIITTENVGDARVSGFEVSYKQSLNFLPAWAQGFSVFGNMTALHLEGGATADFSDFMPKVVNGGISFNRKNFSARINVNVLGTRRETALATSATIPANAYRYRPQQTVYTASFEYAINRHLVLFGSALNLTNTLRRIEAYAPDTPGYARSFVGATYGAKLTFGVKGTF